MYYYRLVDDWLQEIVSGVRHATLFLCVPLGTVHLLRSGSYIERHVLSMWFKLLIFKRIYLF